jgi:hypothetical protein
MKPNFPLLLATLPLAACLSLPLPAAAQVGDLQQFVVAGADAILLETPVSVALGEVDYATWSPSGSYVLARRTRLPGTPAAEATLCLWSAATQKSRDVWKGQGGARIEWGAWLPGTEVAIVLVDRPVPPAPPRVGAAGAAPVAALELERWVLRVDARRGTVQPLIRVPDSTMADVSPTRPVVALFSYEHKLGLVGADGTVRDLSAQLPPGTAGVPQWFRDGLSLRFRGSQGQPAGVKPRFDWYVLDSRTLKVAGPLKALPEDPAPSPPPAGPRRLRTGELEVVREKTRRTVQPLWLESAAPSEQPQVLVTANSTGEPALSPRGNAVLYLGEGGAWVRPFVRFDKAVFIQARDAARRATLMSNAKQLGTGLLMYAADHDEVLPAAGSDLQQLLLPIVKHASLFEDFVYTHPGGKLADIPEPANTTLGYTPAPGGKVWLYVDGHARFVKDE